MDSTLAFGRFELRPAARQLLMDGKSVALGARAFDVLCALITNRDRLVTKQELLELVWPGVVVEENNLQVQVSALRKILGQSALATIPGRGYRFNMPVSHAGSAAPSPAIENPAATHEEPPLDTPDSSASNNLPSRVSSLYGRAEDVAKVALLLRQHAVVTITGPGGIGKTRVAQAVAKQLATEHAKSYPDGVWWVELAALTDGALVPSAVAQAMGVRLADLGDAHALRSQLSGQRLLLVIDNCEHLADAVTTLVDTLVAGSVHVNFLVTSQETLKAADEHVYRLGPLAVPGVTDDASGMHFGAVELFAARAEGVDPRFKLSVANLPAVIEICQRLDGIPLAIELAAARLPLLGVEGLRTRLHERFNLLTGGARMVLRRHQTLRATLEWSHGLLTPDAQIVFRRLSVFAGGFTLEAAQNVVSDERLDPWTALDHLGALVDKSLVLAEGDPVPRYRLLETARAYALERLAESGETQSILRRHALAIHALLEPFDRDEWRWRATGKVVPEAGVELDNLRAALDWADASAEGAQLAVPLAAVSFSVWWSSFQLAEGLSRCLALRRHIDAQVPLHVAAGFWITIAKLGIYATQRESYEAAVKAALLYRELGDDQRCFDALTLGAVQGARSATIDEIETAIAEATRLERSEWPARQRAALQFARCWCFARQGRGEEALTCAQQQVAINREGGVEVAALYAMSNVTLMELVLGRSREALEHSRTAIARLHALDYGGGASHLYCNEMVALMMLDRLDEAFDAARKAYPWLKREGDEYRMLLPLALLNALSGRLETAQRIAALDSVMQARVGHNVESVASLFHRRLEPLLANGLSADARARLAAEGATMRDEEVFKLAFGESS